MRADRAFSFSLGSSLSVSKSILYDCTLASSARNEREVLQCKLERGRETDALHPPTARAISHSLPFVRSSARSFEAYLPSSPLSFWRLSDFFALRITQNSPRHV